MFISTVITIKRLHKNAKSVTVFPFVKIKVLIIFLANRNNSSSLLLLRHTPSFYQVDRFVHVWFGNNVFYVFKHSQTQLLKSKWPRFRPKHTPTHINIHPNICTHTNTQQPTIPMRFLTTFHVYINIWVPGDICPACLWYCVGTQIILRNMKTKFIQCITMAIKDLTPRQETFIERQVDDLTCITSNIQQIYIATSAITTSIAIQKSGIRLWILRSIAMNLDKPKCTETSRKVPESIVCNVSGPESLCHLPVV